MTSKKKCAVFVADKVVFQGNPEEVEQHLNKLKEDGHENVRAVCRE